MKNVPWGTLVGGPRHYPQVESNYESKLVPWDIEVKNITLWKVSVC